MAITKIQSESLNLADTYAFTGTVTGAGGVNTPNWLAVPSGNQSISDVTNTQISFQNEVFDSDSAFASNAFTVPSGKGGKYMLQAQMRINSLSDGKETQMSFRKNGVGDFGESGNNYAVMLESTGAAHNSYYSHTMITNLSAGDVISVWIYHNNGNSRDLNSTYTRFSGFRLVE